MKNVFLLLLTFLCLQVAQAQMPMTVPAGGAAQASIPRGKATLIGVLVDSATGKPVEFGTVALLNPQTKKPIDGTVADVNGKFKLEKLPIGTFDILITFIGYRDKTILGQKITENGDINLGSVKLGSDVRNLKEVNVVGQAAVVEEKVDRIVYNAEKDITNKGGDAADVMRKVPMLTVDLDGNVSLRGSSNVRVLINNKPSTIVASSVADALKQIPADQIKSVEVITSPSAKYDAEGSAGIINIITKKNTMQGGTLTVDAGVGNRGSSLMLNGSLRTGKMGFNLGGFGRANYNTHGATENTQKNFNADGTVNTLIEQYAKSRNNGVFGQYTLGWDYDISKTSALTASLRYGLRSFNLYQDNLTTRTTTTGAFFPVIGSRNVFTKNQSGTVDASLDYTKTFKPQQELTLSGQYSRNNLHNNFTADVLNPSDGLSILSRIQNLNPSINQESTLRLDYQMPFGTNQLFETGVKGIFRTVESDYQYLVASSASSPFVTDANSPANSLHYNQNIAASYVSYTYSTKNKWTLKAGVRYEHTAIRANYSRAAEGAMAGQDLPIPDYSNIVPSINLSKTLKGGKTIKLAYNRRLQRPGIQFLNPNQVSSNPVSIMRGNPLLAAELTDNVELSTGAYIKAVYLNATVFARRTANAITSVQEPISTTLGNGTIVPGLLTTFQNIGRQDAVGMNLFGNATLFSKWQIGGGVDAYYAYLTNNNASALYNSTNSGWVVSARLFSSLNLKNGWGVQGFGFMSGRQIQLQGYRGSFGFYSLGLKKESKDKRSSFGLAGENFFNYPFKMRMHTQTPLFTQDGVFSMYNAGVRANFSYKFGKLSFDQQPKRRTKRTNDDLKDDGGGDQQQSPR